jgi:deazaflavin-dependent oxidoreductase (nitroreductase family)
MSSYIGQKLPVRGALRWALRLPIWLYHAHLGRLLGHQFLLLTHQGRKSGQPRQTVLEVVRYDRATRTYVVASGWGITSDWYRNIQQNPNVVVESGSGRVEARAAILPPTDAARELRNYARQHPYRARELTRMITGESSHSQPAEIVGLADQIPLVALRPR